MTDDLLNTLLTTLPGIDTKTGLNNINNKMIIYKTSLLMFLNRWETFEVQFNDSLLNKDDLESAKHLVHSLKGLSAQLGIFKVNEAAIALESACISGQKDKINSCFKVLSVELKPVVDGLNRLKNESDN